tara:strand:- start:235814 stop:235954 length:141 start_codon:yes stop_codon:yes gene_type:complete
MSQYFRKFTIGFVAGLYSFIAIDVMVYGLSPTIGQDTVVSQQKQAH